MNKKVGIRLSKDSGETQILACELDNEEHWDEVSDVEFTARNIKDLSLEISNGVYLYSVKTAPDLYTDFIDIENGVTLTDKIRITELMDELKELSITNKDIVKEGNNSLLFTIRLLGETVGVKETKLISFTSKKSVIQFIM